MIKLKLILLITVLVILDITSFKKSAQAQIHPTRQVAAEPSEPPNRGSPDDNDRRPAGTRSPCEQTDISLTPLLPITDEGFTGFTLREYPTFWFYVPYQTDSVSSGKFVLRDREDNVVYRSVFQLPKKPGFVSVSIPTTEKPLEKNQQYSWKFVLDCTSQNSDQPPIFHEGLVQRVDMANLETQLQTATLPERIQLYVDNKIWYDAPTDLAQIREFTQAWRKLLKAIGLEELEQEPIGGSVQLIKN